MIVDVLWIRDKSSIQNQTEEVLRKKTLDRLRRFLHREHHIDKVSISVSPKGKPYLNGSHEIYFSISHTNKVTCIAVSKQPIGIDVEKIGAFQSKIINTFYSIEEKKLISRKSDDLDYMNRVFYQIWTRKEALCKCNGEGITRTSLSVDTLNVSDYSMSSFAIGDYILTICIQGEAIHIYPRMRGNNCNEKLERLEEEK